MASLTKTYSSQKLHGQVYTPEFIVAKILDDTGFTGPGLINKSILDPACGDGQFLVEVVRRIISVTPPRQLESALLQVHGWDIDEQAIDACRRRLDHLVTPLQLAVDWQLKVTDALQPTDQSFDFIVGNPPYVRIQHLAAAQRQYIQDHFVFCKTGATDLYIAFIEQALRLCKPEGMIGFIVPNSVLLSEAAAPLRRHLLTAGWLRNAVNYGDIQLFEGATTYCAILTIQSVPQQFFTFQKALSATVFQSLNIETARINHAPWRIAPPGEMIKNGKRLGDIARIHVGLTTLCDKAYLMTALDTSGPVWTVENALAGVIRIEKTLLKPVLKASRLRSDPTQHGAFILFPYQQQAGRHHIIPEAVLTEQYPLTWQHLLSVKPELDKRDAGKPNPVTWYAYGRSQGLDTSFGTKILFSPMSDRPYFMYCADPETTFYSGYCIKYDGDVAALLQQLNSDRMAAYIDTQARDFRGGWKAYNKKVVEGFVVEQ